MIRDVVAELRAWANGRGDAPPEQLQAWAGLLEEHSRDLCERVGDLARREVYSARDLVDMRHELRDLAEETRMT